MESIFIPRLLKAPQQQEILEVDENLKDLETLTPVRGTMSVRHCKTYLEVKAQASAIVTLVCDRTLQNYNERLEVDTTELIWLQLSSELEALPREREVSLDDLQESIDPHGYFDPEAWLYEQFCLALPLRNVSNLDNAAEVNVNVIETEQDTDPQIDSRWAKLADLKQQLSS